MDLVDHTPFASLVFESLTVDGDSFVVVAIRGTFEIQPGKVLLPSPEQGPVIVADEYRGAPHTSSVCMANDLAPWKPNADIVVSATAHSRGGQFLRSWPIEVQVGKKHLGLQVTGPNHWVHRWTGWKLVGPEPCRTTPVIYEHAFGGHWVLPEPGGVFEKNPVGVGYVDPNGWDPREPVPAPRVLALDEKPPTPGQTAIPRGIGAIAPAWMPRREHAGTYDDTWQRTRAPAIPADFQFDFYNAAHPDLIYDGYLRGDEAVCLRGLWEGGELTFGLPAFRLGAVLTDKSGYQFASVAELDTLQIDVDKLLAYLVWRVAAPLTGDPLIRIELKMSGAGAHSRK